MEHLSTPELAMILVGVIGTAIIAGILAGLLGVGGGIVLVPVLFWILSLTDFPPDLSMHMAVATSLATIIFTSVSSARAHHKRGGVDKSLLKLWAPGIILGALSGGLAAKYINGDGLRGIFGAIALLVAINMATPKTLVISDKLPGSKLVNGLISYVTGFFSALMGIGGGTLSVPLLVAFSVEVRRAVGTASAFGILIAVPAVIGFISAGWGIEGRPPLSLGYVNLLAAGLILPFTVSFAPVGAKIAHSVDPKWIKRAFALFLAITAIRMLMSVFG
ncbi:sulfite exporter TauE/SafE family protein [Donghicola mangrovi]|uniref:Probable membrane transporter protein n=1 Tax=Donghicola mangrovi TaxID=2729614 RepID=A0A850Q2E9_9RHOB|nr:sulfite exporter TauE/SafE family protein [Donghicola mangrovi]NVO23797.1 sulfite exporter TauE/SafE family protein [Donghicola mangrovi]